VSPEFKGKGLVLQHRLVNEVLNEEISKIHGLTLTTKTPEQYEELMKKPLV
jgi:stress-induced morphogen